MVYLTVSETRGIFIPERGRRIPLTRDSAVSALGHLKRGLFYARPEVVSLLGLVACRATVECRLVMENPRGACAAWRLYRRRCDFGYLL